MISVEKNLALEEIYLNSVSKKASKNENRKRKNIEGYNAPVGVQKPAEENVVGDEPIKTDKNVPKKRLPKKKCALLISYCGSGYSGLQINPQVASIELDLHKALAMAGAVSEDNQMNPIKNNFSRCARTDKGVHAGGNIVSLKMHLVENVIEKINSFLPKQVPTFANQHRLGFGIIRS
jgi:tRNA pseudouridine38-40 synthase